MDIASLLRYADEHNMLGDLIQASYYNYRKYTHRRAYGELIRRMDGEFCFRERWQENGKKKFQDIKIPDAASNKVIMSAYQDQKNLFVECVFHDNHMHILYSYHPNDPDGAQMMHAILKDFLAYTKAETPEDLKRLIEESKGAQAVVDARRKGAKMAEKMANA